MEPLRTIFARHGLRCTVQREDIYVALSSTKAHPTAEELFEEVKKKRPGMSLATIYNTLDAFTRRGLARKFNDPVVGVTRFDADTSVHVHFITDEGRIRDVPPDLGDRLLSSLSPEMLDEIEQRMGVRVDQVRLEFVGKNTSGGRC